MRLTRRATAGLLCLHLATGCSPQLRPGLATSCTAFQPDCAAREPVVLTAAEGETRKWVQIDSEPTAAAIYLNGRFIGYSPLRYRIGFSSGDRAIDLVAVPLYPGQAQQQQVIAIPPLPARVSFFMNNPAADAADSLVPLNSPPLNDRP
jgi:hypothetical protein